MVIHAVSAGEMAAAEPIIAALAESRPDIGVVLTTCCADGRAVAERIRERRPTVEGITWMPWDSIGSIQGWLSRLGPDLVVVVETEIWPGLFFACRDLGVPLCIADGRIYPRDVWRYRLALPFFRRVLDCVSWIGAQSVAERDRFVAIGARPERVDVVGNPKYEVALPSPSGDDRVRRLADAGAIVVAGSTHEPEERWVLGAFNGLRHDFPELRLVLAPRKIERAARVLGHVAEFAFRPVSWSTWGGGDVAWDVLILDQLGWLTEVYGCARVIVIGGTFIDHGGQNPIEAAARGLPVIMGPSVQNFDEIVGDLEGAGGLVRVADASGLEGALRGLLGDPGRAVGIGDAARRCVAAHQGVAGRYAAALLGHRLKP